MHRCRVEGDGFADDGREVLTMVGQRVGGVGPGSGR
jgi:hypothetical protein